MRFCIRSIFQKYLIPLLQIFLCISQEKLVVFASDIFSSQLRHWIALKLLVQLNLNAIEHWTFNISHYKRVKNKWILFKRGSCSQNVLSWNISLGIPFSVWGLHIYFMYKYVNIKYIIFSLGIAWTFWTRPKKSFRHGPDRRL